jgi:hypothetical protein
MDQAAGYVESPTQKPKNDENGKNRPKHRYPFKSENYKSTTVKGERLHSGAELSLQGGISGGSLAAPPDADRGCMNPLTAKVAA